MAIKALKTIRIVTFTALGLWHVGQPIDAISAAVSEAKVSLANVQKDDSKDSGGDQVAVKFSREEVDSITKALPEGEARQIFKEKVIKSEEKDDAAFDESLRSGEELSLLFFDGEKAFSRAQERLVSFFTKPTSTIDTHEWGAAFDNHIGRSGEAIEMVEKTMQLNPAIPAWYLTTLGAAYARSGRQTEAVTTHKRVFDQNPSHEHAFTAHLSLAILDVMPLTLRRRVVLGS